MSDDESTQEIDIEALRDSLAAARGKRPSEPDPPSDRETARGQASADVDPFGLLDRTEGDDNDRTVMATSPKTRRMSERPAFPGSARPRHDSEPPSVTKLDVALPAGGMPTPIEPIRPMDLLEPESIEESGTPWAPTPWEPVRDSAAMILDDESIDISSEPNIDLADVDDVEDVEESTDGAVRSERAHAGELEGRSPSNVNEAHGLEAQSQDPSPSLFGTIPGHDVAQALRAMMGEVPDAPAGQEPLSLTGTAWSTSRSPSLEDGETQTRLPLAETDQVPPTAFSAGMEASGDDDALPAFSLDESSDDEGLDDSHQPWSRPAWGHETITTGEAPITRVAPAALDVTSITRVAPQGTANAAFSSVELESTSITRALGAAVAMPEMTETTAVFRGPVPSLARPPKDEPSEAAPNTDEVAAADPLASASLTFARADSFDVDPLHTSAQPTRHDPPPSTVALPDPDDMQRGELPRFTLASIPEMSDTVGMPEPAPAPSELLESMMDTGTLSAHQRPLDDGHHDDPKTIMRASSPELIQQSRRDGGTSSPSMPSIDVRISSSDVDTSAFDQGPGGVVPSGGPDASDVDEVQHTARINRDELGVTQETAAPSALAPSALPPISSSSLSATSDLVPEADIEEIEDAEIMELVPDEIIEDDQTSASLNAPTHAASATPSAAPPPAYRAPTRAASGAPPALLVDAMDAEERELYEEGRFGPLIAVYRQRLASTDGPNKKAALLLKIAGVYETGMMDGNEAFQTLVEAFEIAPDNADVVAAVDRVGKDTQRIGELADKVKKKFLPGSPDDRRVVFLGHLVYWYERVLSRGSEVSSFVSEIERHDKVHPVVLKRAAQLAAMNGDVKTQREYLQRALERTTRRQEKVILQLALASAYAGTPDALKHYELTLQLDPASIVALQGVKRLGKEKEQYGQVQWALERQAEVALSDSEKIDALLELAELQETKFLKREAAAELLERVLEIEPSQPQAMKGLERCYHALRDWPKLARVLGIRSEHTFDKKAKVELLELAAEVHESKLGDAAGAVEVYRNLLVVEPKHRRALIDLARLYEKLGDWSNVATYKARLAELAPTKRASSQELVKLGDFLNTPERDPIAAKLQYERAVSVDPTNAAGWEALQKLAAEAGDDRRVIECLEQRKKHTDVPRQRAAVLVELAKVHQAAGDEDAALKSYEAAIRADSSNEIAAVAMLDAYTAEERWAEAAPLCELLVNAAIRDRDGESLFVRLRLATRIAAALGDADRAMTSAIAALDARPKDPGAQADLIAVASQCRGTSTSVERARKHLLGIAESGGELPGDHLVRLALLQRDFGDLDGAAVTFERARRLEPEDQDIIRDLADVYLAQGDFPRACKLKVDMARNATSAETRFDLFCEAGEIWARRAEELEKAASVFEEARAIKPMDPWLLQTMMWLYGELGEWGLLTGVLEDMAQVQESPADKIKSLMSMADVVRDKLDDRVRAADLFDQVLDLDKKRLGIFEELVRTLTEEKNWERLERSYRKMIARVKDDDEPQLQFLLFHQLGLIYRDRLGDASRAYDALDAASRLRPDDAEVRKIVIELLVVTDNLDNAVARLRDEISRDPHEPQLYAELYELFLRQLFFDKAWCAVNVLSRLRDPTPEQRRFHEDYAPMPLDRVPGQIVEQAWRSHIFHPDLEPSLSNIFAVLAPAVARMRYNQLRPEQRVGRPFTPQHSRMHDAIRATFNNSSEILAVAPPELLLGDLTAMSPFLPALAPFGAILVCGPAVEAQSMSLVYLVGKRLAEQRPELTARSFFPSLPDLSSLLATAVRVSRNEIAKDAAGAAQDQAFAATLSPQEAATLRSVVLQATSESVALDVKRWLQAADLSSMRAGLLIAGDVEPARQAILAEVVSGSDLTPREKVGELYQFATSDLYSDLRGAIGVAVQA